MGKSISQLPKGRKIAALSNPQLVATIRNTYTQVITYKLIHGSDPIYLSTLLRAAEIEAVKRKITINHPELDNESST